MVNKNLESLAGSLFLIGILPFIAWVMNMNKDEQRPVEWTKTEIESKAPQDEPANVKPQLRKDECEFKSDKYCYVYIHRSGMVSLDEAMSSCEGRWASLPRRKDIEANRETLWNKVGNTGTASDIGYLWALDENDEYASPESISDYYPTSQAASIMDWITLGRKEIGYACVKPLSYRTFPSRPNRMPE